jgi:hypothetical protein
MRLETKAAGDGQEPKQEVHTWENHPMRESKTRRKLGAAKIQAGSVEHTMQKTKYGSIKSTNQITMGGRIFCEQETAYSKLCRTLEREFQ